MVIIMIVFSIIITFVPLFLTAKLIKFTPDLFFSNLELISHWLRAPTKFNVNFLFLFKFLPLTSLEYLF